MRRKAALTAGLLALSLSAPAVAASARPGGHPAARSATYGWQPGPAAYGVVEKLNVAFTMHDGTRLVGSVYYPARPGTHQRAPGRFPVLVTMTPYGMWDGNSQQPHDGSDDLEMRYFASHGYIGLEVDSRGSARSEGIFSILAPQQSRDYLQIIGIAAHHLPGSNGVVGLMGMSYRGLDQLLVGGLLRRGTPVKAMAPASAGTSIYDDPFFQGGIPSDFWYVYQGVLEISAVPPLDQGTSPGGSASYSPTVIADRARSQRNISAGIDQVEAGGSLAYRDRYWQAREPYRSARAIVRAGVPVLLTTGPTDYFARGALRMYAALQDVAHGASPNLPMPSGWRPDRRFELVYADPYSDGDYSYWLSYELQWYDHWLKGENNGIAASDQTLRVQETGDGNHWVAPPRGRYPVTSNYTKLFLTASNALAPKRPAAASTAPMQWGSGATATFTTPAFHRPVTAAGPVDVHLRVRSSAPQVELIAELDDVAPDGTATRTVPGFEVDGDLIGSLRAVSPAKTWRDRSGAVISPYHPLSTRSARPVPTNRPQTYDIELHPKFLAVAPGHRLRLVLSTTNYQISPTATQVTGLAGGRYTVLTPGSWVNLPLLSRRLPATADPESHGLGPAS